ncbi:MAG: hypothetical protein KGI54_18130 [Pseudomonadota bacterium]|nr:hypothetical protein [Pseudomonadota bacterium]
MKKLIFLSALFIGTVCSAQNSSPRWGAGPPSEDNTGRILTYAFTQVTTTASQAIAYQRLPNAFENIVQVDTLKHALTDSVNVINAYKGDKLIFTFVADTLPAGRVVTFGNHLKSAGTLTVPKSASKSGRAEIAFMFDGTEWVELYRTITTN